MGAPHAAPGASGLQPTRTAGSSPLRVLRNRNFRFLWIGGVVSASGVATANVIIIWMLYASTHSAFLITLVGVLEFIPTLTIGVLAGALADRYDRRRIMVTSLALRAGLLGTLSTFVFLFGFDPVAVLLTVFFVSAFGSLFTPASHAILPKMLHGSETNDGNGVLEVGWSGAAFLGAPLGGVLLETLGVVTGLIYNGATFAISAIVISLIAIPVATAGTEAKADPRRQSLLSDVRAGMRYLRSQSALLRITVLGTAGNFFVSMALAYMVVYASVVLHTSAIIFGILGGIGAVAWGGGSLMAGRLGTERRPGLWCSACWGVAAIPLALMVLAPSIPLALACVGINSGLSALGNNVWRSTVQRTVPDTLLGRYFAIDEAGAFAMIPAGIIVGGVVLVLWGIVPMFVIAAIGASGSNLVLLLSRDVRAWGRPTVGPTGAGE